MHDHELDSLLKTVPLPERPPQFWNQFPRQVTNALQNPNAPPPERTRIRPSRVGWKFAFAVACLVVGLVIGRWTQHRPDALGLAQARELFQQITRVFPHQVSAIIIDAQGVRLELAKQANLPTSPPLLIAVRQDHSWRQFITFSGQNIRLNGESFEVLTTADGKIFLVGPHSIWSDTGPAGPANPYQIQATPLEASL